MNLMSIKHGSTDFAALQDNGTITLKCGGSIISDNISATLNIVEYNGGLLSTMSYTEMQTKTNAELASYTYEQIGV